MIKYLNIKYIMIAAFVSMGWALYGQTAQEIMIGVSKTMNNARSYEMNVDVNVYKKATDTAPYFKYGGKTAKQDGSYYINMMEKITLMNSECALMVDKKQKLIMYKPIDKRSAAAMSAAYMQVNIDSIIRNNSKGLSLISSGPDRQVVSLSTPASDIQSMTITIDTRQHTMREIAYTYLDHTTNTTAKVTIIYSQVKINENVNSALFDHKKFISVSGTKVLPKEAYKNYKVINQSENTF